jgi:uncharacterized protein
MHYTLHLTNRCNMACNYCYVDPTGYRTMTAEIARKAVDRAAVPESSESVGIIFFGGEPLLCKNLIRETVEYCKWKQAQGHGRFHFKVTTNGLLLDQEFIDLSKQEDIFIALSHDGIQEAHDSHRVDLQACGTFSRLSDKIHLLLSHRPYAPVLMTINPDTARFYSASVEYLYSMGFKYLICSLNYAANWDEHSLKVLREEYEKLADFYYRHTLAEDKFYLSPFEVKISSHIHRSSYCRERCELGMKQVSVGPDGHLYPCVQFVGQPEYAIGHVDTGIERERQLELYQVNEEEKESCRECTIRDRCNHHCGCLNKQSTGRIDQVSPVLCAHERLLLPIADRLAERLYKRRSALFIQKHYNDMYPLISAIEDRK